MASSPLDIRHLQTLIALSDTGSLAKAADRVFVTQSALSHQLKALETHYGTPLFERNTKPLRFTQAGSRLLKAAREVVQITAQAEREVAQWVSGRSGELRVAVECHTCFDWLMPVMDEFRVRWPEVEVDLLAGFHSDPLDLLKSGKAELVIGSQKPRGRDYVALPLFRFEILVVMPLEHRLRTKRRVAAADLKG